MQKKEAIKKMEKPLLLDDSDHEEEPKRQEVEEMEEVTTIDVSIEGMNCANGCARYIEKEMSKKQGIVSCLVNFEEKTGQVKFLSKSKWSPEKVVEAIVSLKFGCTVITPVHSCCAAAKKKQQEKEKKQQEVHDDDDDDEDLFTTINVEIEGMNCANGCARYIEKEMNSKKGILSCVVNFEKKTAQIKFPNNSSSSGWSCHKVVDAIVGLNFGCKLITSPNKIQQSQSETSSKKITVLDVSIEGMNCANGCARYIEKEMNKKKGILSCVVNFEEKTAQIKFPSSSSNWTSEKVIEAVTALKFGCKLLNERQEEEVEEEKEELQSSKGTSNVLNINTRFSATAAASSTSYSPPPDEENEGEEENLINHNNNEKENKKKKKKQQTKSGNSSIDLIIKGWTCASCSGKTESALSDLEGVVIANANFSTNTVSITFNDSQTNSQALVEVVKSLGYDAEPVDEGDTTALRASLERTEETAEAWTRFWVTTVIALPLAIVVMTFHNNAAARKEMEANGRIVNHLTWLHIVELVFSTPVVVWLGRHYYIHAWQALKHCTFTMDTLVTIGVLGSYFYSVVAFVLSALGTVKLASYFETSSTLLGFMLLGKFLESNAKRQTSSALVKLMDLAPPMAILVTEEKGDVTVPSKTIKKGNLVRVLAGERIPVDGVVLEGRGAVDESMVTGESVPQEKEPESKVIGGTLNVNNDLVIEAEKVGEETMLSQILKIVREALGQKPEIQRVADQVAGVFVPFVLIWALCVFIIWLSLGLTNSYPEQWRRDAAGAHGDSGNDNHNNTTNSSSNSSSSHNNDDNGSIPTPLSFAISFTIAAIVISCPCALGLACPTAVTVGTSMGAENGVLIKGGPCLEAARSVNCVLFDKTGTLTTGELRVTGYKVTNVGGKFEEAIICQLLGTVESRSTHPIAKCLTAHFGTLQPPFEQNTEVLRGSGISSEIFINSCTCGPSCGCIYRNSKLRSLVGSLKLMKDNNVEIDNEIEKFVDNAHAEGRTVICMAVEKLIRICVALADEPKLESFHVITEMKKRGIRVCMVTGDNKHAAARVAKAVGIDREEDIFSQQLPHEKAEVVKKLQQEHHDRKERSNNNNTSKNDGEKSTVDKSIVAFVGDGVNDSPALAQANVGIALGAGTEVAIESADAVLVRNSLPDILHFFDLSTATVNRIHLNFVWAFLYNLCALPFASGVFFPLVHWQLPPIAAGAAMVGSSLTVLCSSLLLKYWKPSQIPGCEKKTSLGVPPRTTNLKDPNAWNSASTLDSIDVLSSKN